MAKDLLLGFIFMLSGALLSRAYFLQQFDGLFIFSVIMLVITIHVLAVKNVESY